MSNLVDIFLVSLASWINVGDGTRTRLSGFVILMMHGTYEFAENENIALFDNSD